MYVRISERWHIYYYSLWQYESVNYHIYNLIINHILWHPHYGYIHFDIICYQCYIVYCLVYIYWFDWLLSFKYLLSFPLLVFWFWSSGSISAIHFHFKFILRKIIPCVMTPSYFGNVSSFCNCHHSGWLTRTHSIFCYFVVFLFSAVSDEDVNDVIVFDYHKFNARFQCKQSLWWRGKRWFPL